MILYCTGTAFRLNNAVDQITSMVGISIKWHRYAYDGNKVGKLMWGIHFSLTTTYQKFWGKINWIIPNIKKVTRKSLNFPGSPLRPQAS
jgi:hypothetical protein